MILSKLRSLVGRSRFAPVATAAVRTAKDRTAHHRTVETPPSGLRFMNEDDEAFLAAGDELLADMRSWGLVRSDSTILDIGSGYGRFAHALLRWPEFHGTYRGFDILERHVRWTATHLSRVFSPSVTFEYLDVHNSRYNPQGTIAGDEVVFSAETGSVDAILLASVFTHMYPSHVLRYLSECHRVLRPGGRVVASFFVLDESWSEGEATGRAAYPMTHELTSFCRYADADDPLFAIGYTPAWIGERVAELGLSAVGAPHLGRWCARPGGGPRWQDFVVLKKR